jgi:hypothetical protein
MSHCNPLIRGLAAALAIAAIAAPAATAQPADIHDGLSQAAPAKPAFRAPDLDKAARAQERYYQSFGTKVPNPVQDLRSPDSRDAADGRGTFNAPKVTVVEVPAPADDGGLDWGDAGIGAGGALIAIALAFGGTAVVVRRRHQAAPTV